MKNKGYGISYKKKTGSRLLLLLCAMLLTGCRGEGMNGESDIVYLEASSMQAWSPTEKPEETLVETKDEGIDENRESTGTDGNQGNADADENRESTGEGQNQGDELATPIPGRKTIANLLLTAREPLGSTMYIWGGGWNEEDTAAGEEARSIGVSPRWAEFAASQDAAYNFDNTRYRIHDGLDCSGYVGWVIYNVFETEDGHEGYVMGSTKMAQNFAERGWGTYTPAEQVSNWQAGDIMSMKGHVWISLGMCGDGSVVLLHASPPGVILSGTLLPGGEKSQAVQLAEEYMSAFYPEWYEKYPDCSRSYSYLTGSSRMRWSSEVLSDEEGLAGKSAGEVLEWLFGKKE